MRSNNFFILVILGLLLGLGGCMAIMGPPIHYSVDDIQESTNKQLKEVVLDIRPFEDVRKRVPENAILFSESRDDFHLKIGEKKYCINREEDYSGNKEDVPLQVATVIAKHLSKRGAFKAVTVNNKVALPVVYEESKNADGEVETYKAIKQEKIPADYYLTGKLRKLYGQQEYIKGAMGMALLLGPVAQVATSVMETPLYVEIEIVDLAVYKNDGQLLANIGDVHEKFSEKTAGGNLCKNIYKHVNDKLKHVIDQLAEKTETTVIDNKS